MFELLPAVGNFIMMAAEGAAAPLIDLSTVDFTPLTDTIAKIVPKVLPVVVSCCGLRKGISFMMGCIRGA